VDSDYNLDWQTDYINYVADKQKPHADWKTVAAQRPKFLRFWYRQAESPLTALSFHSTCSRPA